MDFSFFLLIFFSDFLVLGNNELHFLIEPFGSKNRSVPAVTTIFSFDKPWPAAIMTHRTLSRHCNTGGQLFHWGRVFFSFAIYRLQLKLFTKDIFSNFLVLFSTMNCTLRCIWYSFGNVWQIFVRISLHLEYAISTPIKALNRMCLSFDNIKNGKKIRWFDKFGWYDIFQKFNVIWSFNIIAWEL